MLAPYQQPIEKTGVSSSLRVCGGYRGPEPEPEPEPGPEPFPGPVLVGVDFTTEDTEEQPGARTEIIAASTRSNETRQTPGSSVHSEEATDTNEDLRNEDPSRAPQT